MLKATGAEWTKDRATRLAAALAFYSLLSLAPLVVLAVHVAGMVFGEAAAKGQISAELGSVMGPSAAEAVESIVAHADRPESTGIGGTVVGTVILLFGASGVLGELQSAMNTIWGVAPRPGRGILGVIRDRFFSVTLVLGAAFLLLVSLIISAGLVALGEYLANLLSVYWLMRLANFVITLGVTTTLFALMFKFIPDAKVGWKPAWMGAVVTALLFSLGKLLLGLYFAHSSVASSYGAAGSLVATIVWVYYSAQIWFLGAEFTEVYARRSGQAITPAPDAVLASEVARTEARKARSLG